MCVHPRIYVYVFIYVLAVSGTVSPKIWPNKFSCVLYYEINHMLLSFSFPLHSICKVHSYSACPKYFVAMSATSYPILSTIALNKEANNNAALTSALSDLSLTPYIRGVWSLHSHTREGSKMNPLTEWVFCMRGGGRAGHNRSLLPKTVMLRLATVLPSLIYLIFPDTFLPPTIIPSTCSDFWKSPL